MSDTHLRINGQPVSVTGGLTILEAARAAGIFIPSLCHHPAVSNHGACRICLVEVKGMRGLQTACTCPVTEGMEVATETDEIAAGRRFVLELLFSERNHYCMYCQVSGDCELQTLAYRYGLDHWRYPRPYRKMAIDASHPYIIMEPNRCILCTRCVRACAEIAANHTLGLCERGSDSMLMADLGVPLGESSCVSCGTCLQVCPTGALIDAKSAYGGHEEDLTHTRTTCMQCSVGCALDVVTRASRLLLVEGVWGSGPSGGLLCADGRFAPLWERRERITAPEVRQNGGRTAVSWDEALAAVAGRLRQGGVLGLAACATTNEALDAFARLFGALGCPVGRLEPAAPLLGGTAGRLQDLLEADLILVAGVDPLRSQRVVGSFIRRAVDRGARLLLLGECGDGLAEVATLAVGETEVEKVVAETERATRPVIVYGAGVRAEALAALRRLAAKARVLALEAARNGKGAEHAGLRPQQARGAEALYFLLGEEPVNGDLAARMEGSYTIVQASYRSALTEKADVLLPAPIWAERSGHITNLEGAVLPLTPILPMPSGVRDEAEILQAITDMAAR
jgi:formate dehydrogenase major subunit